MSYHSTRLLQAVSSALIRVTFAGVMIFVSSSAARRKPFMAANEGRRHLRESFSSVTSPATNVVENFTLLTSGTSTLEAPSTPEASERPSTSLTTNSVVMVTAVVTLASVVTVFFVIWTIEHYYICWRGHSLRDNRSDVSMRTNLMAEIADRYWMNVEPYIKSTLLFAEEARSTSVFRTITEYDLFAYKFRTEDGIYKADQSVTRVRDSQRYSQNPFQTVKELEHIFEMLAALLPKRSTAVDKTAQRNWLRQLMTKLHCRRAVRAPQFQTQSSFARSLCRVACRLALAWGDDYRYVINDVIKFLKGDCDNFLSQTEDDRSLATRILAAVPYVHSLQLVGGHFRLKVADDNNARVDDTGGGELMARQRLFDVQVRRQLIAIDARLSTIRTAADAEILTSMTALTFANVVDSYRELRDVCTAVGIVRSGPDYPTILGSDRRTQISPLDCIVLVRHLIRLTFGVVSNVRRLQRPTAADYEARFRRFVCGFHDSVLLLEQIPVAGVGVRGFGGRAAVNRCAGNIVACVSALTGDVTREPADADHTKAVLEMVERSLARHFVWLTSRRQAAFDASDSATIEEPTSRRPQMSMSTTTTVAEIATVASGSKRPPVTFDLPSSIAASDLSIYATGLSKSPVSSTAEDSPFTSSESAVAGSWPVGGEVFPVRGDDGVWETAL